MATLTATQRSDLQADTGIGTDQSVFTDAELDRLYTRAEGVYNLTVVYVYRQLLANSVRLADYTQNESQEKLSQVRDNLEFQLRLWEDLAGVSGVSLQFGVLDLRLNEDEIS